MHRLITADWFRIGRHWLTLVLFVLLIVILIIQVNGKLNRLSELHAELERSTSSGEELTEEQVYLQGGQRLEAEWLSQKLQFPTIIGYTARLATDYGLFILILLTAVLGGEDFTRRTLSNILTRGVGRGHYLISRAMALWITAGVGILIITLLAAIFGPLIHIEVTKEPIKLDGIGGSLLVAVRTWFICLPFIIATLFWAVLARHSGPAIGVGIGLHFFEVLFAFVLPLFALIASIAGAPVIFQSVVNFVSVTLGYNADVFITWGKPTMEGVFMASRAGLGGDSTLPTAPLRATVFLMGYMLLFFGWALWILRRRDVTYGS
ncbi:MAG: hypothetical protein GTO18_19735 [Anaerolineales bacterium]|nr:hypothetical protein [Anaerolineales bacterium]